ncbi:uncharacterized protein CIMG_12593 [Coccidioides immitis RS]|uniref:Uncharacterized protein n=1 Tax=Coccidioides immitis (strain RS) TaxID=246410 RepID=J3K014_COCIM|nr:uncharacterized protein CIMG_12593 [Coccidioides immitis RS]EAS27147.3 hypothetical protein CIMG_12593 [Coccidioides immitis RS]
MLLLISFSIIEMFLNAYKLFETNRQKNDNHIFAKSFLTNNIGTLNDNVNQKYRALLTLRILTWSIFMINKISDVDGDNRNNRDNRADRNNRDNRDNKDNKDNKKSSSHVLENTDQTVQQD